MTGLRVGWFPAHHPLNISVAHRQHGFHGGLLDAEFSYDFKIIPVWQKCSGSASRSALLQEMRRVASTTNVAIKTAGSNILRGSWEDEVLAAFPNLCCIRKSTEYPGVLPTLGPRE
ncbi:hypothetical protein V8E36_003433 [Tilletia maclaganii]